MENGKLYLLQEHSLFCMSFVICSPEGEFLVPVSHEMRLHLDQRRLSDARLCSASVGNYRVNLSENKVE